MATEDGVKELEEARRQIEALDGELLEVAARRIRVARQLASIKAARDLPIVDYPQERRVLERGARRAREVGLDADVAADLLSRLMVAAVSEQEAVRLRQAATGEGRHAVVVGGAGRMGRWMVDFLRTQAFQVDVLDPGAAPELEAAARGALPGSDLVICATPPLATAELYGGWLEEPPSGLVCDIASSKTPLLGPIGALREAGARVGSFHPMFGPDTLVLRGADVVLCDTGDPEALAQLERLFAPTSARLLRIPLERHDRLMADVLALAHVTALAFAGTLVQRGRGHNDLHSTTYKALVSVAAKVVRESPEVYYEIQAENPHARGAVEGLRDTLRSLAEIVERGDLEAFRGWMERAARLLPDDE